MNSRAMEIEAEIEGLTKEGDRILAHLETLKVQYDRGLISRPLYEKTVEEAKIRLASIDARIPALAGERERLGTGESAASAPSRVPALEPPSARAVPAAAPRPAPPAVPDGLVRKVEEALAQAREARSDIQRLRPVLEALAPRVAAVEDRAKGLPELRDQVRQLAERQARLEALARELDRAFKTEFQRLADMVKPVPAALERLQEDLSTARIEIKALKYEAEALNTLQEDRLRSLEEAAAGKKR